MTELENVPIYVKIDKHRELLEAVKAIEAKLASVQKTIDRINELKAAEDTQLKGWTENLADVKTRLERINGAFHGG